MAENNRIYNSFNELLKEFKEHPEKVTEEDRSKLKSIFFGLFDPLSFSKHSAWRVDWLLEKRYKDDDEKPYETMNGQEFLRFEDAFGSKKAFAGNIILDGGANEMLKLICGTGGTAFNNANAKIYVGTDSTPEKASQSGVIATERNRAFASMDSGYPVVSGRTATWRASFGNDTANFAWQEASITNGSGVGAVALNRKVDSMGTKNGGTWTLQVSVSLVSA